MNTGKKLTILCLLAFALITCKKETLQPGNSVGTPTFYFTGTVNGAAVNLTAGVSNYYMYSSDTQDVNNVYHFIANLHPTNCSNCPNSIQFIINDYKITSLGASATIDTSLKPAFYAYLTPSGGAPTTYSINYNAQTKGPDSSGIIYHYAFSDGSTALGGSNITHIYKNPGTASAKLTATFPGHGTDTITNVSQLTLNAFNTAFSHSNSPIMEFNDSILTPAVAPYTIQWNFGNGSTDSHPYSGGVLDTASTIYSLHSIFQVTAVATDANGNTNTTIAKVNPFGVSADYISQFITDSLTPVSNPKAFSNITVIYTDLNGTAYSSANATQLPASAFQITTVSSYENNVNGQTTKMLHIKFNCQLKDAGGQTITINNGDAVIAVAYK